MGQIEHEDELRIEQLRRSARMFYIALTILFVVSGYGVTQLSAFDLKAVSQQQLIATIEDSIFISKLRLDMRLDTLDDCRSGVLLVRESGQIGVDTMLLHLRHEIDSMAHCDLISLRKETVRGTVEREQAAVSLAETDLNRSTMQVAWVLAVLISMLFTMSTLTRFRYYVGIAQNMIRSRNNSVIHCLINGVFVSLLLQAKPWPRRIVSAVLLLDIVAAGFVAFSLVFDIAHMIVRGNMVIGLLSVAIGMDKVAAGVYLAFLVSASCVLMILMWIYITSYLSDVYEAAINSSQVGTT